MEIDKYLDLQQTWANEIIIFPKNKGFQFQPTMNILSLDVQYSDEMAYVAADIQSFDGQFIQTFGMITHTNFEYIPSLFCFREAPPLLTFIQYLQKNKDFPPFDVILVDGHGIAHHRKFGVASCVGLLANMPTLGCAKDTLVKYNTTLNIAKNSTADIFLGDEMVGYAFRSQENIKPLYVSAGHLISQEESLEIVKNLCKMYRNPEPLRRADAVARLLQKGERTKEYIFLGEMECVKI